jgi:hypothetical protein
MRLHGFIEDADGFFLSQPGGNAHASIFRIVFRDSPNSRAASRMLIPTPWPGASGADWSETVVPEQHHAVEGLT